MSGMDRLTDELLEAYAAGKWKSYERDNIAMARELLAHRRASQAAPAPSDGLREALEECDCCVDGLQADGETPCPYCTKPAIPVADAAEALLEAHKSGAWLVGQGRTLEQVAMIIAALRAALSTPTEERQ